MTPTLIWLMTKLGRNWGKKRFCFFVNHVTLVLLYNERNKFVEYVQPQPKEVSIDSALN